MTVRVTYCEDGPARAGCCNRGTAGCTVTHEDDAAARLLREGFDLARRRARSVGPGTGRACIEPGFEGCIE